MIPGLQGWSSREVRVVAAYCDARAIKSRCLNETAEAEAEGRFHVNNSMAGTLKFWPSNSQCSQSRKFVLVREKAGREGRSKQKERNVYALWNVSVLCSIRYSYEVWKYTWRHKRGHSHSPCSGLWEQDMMPKQRGASLATKFRGASPGVQVPEMGEAEATYLKQEPMQCARLVEVMRGKGDLVLMVGTVVVSRPQRAGPVAVAWTGRSMQAPNKRFVAKEESSEKEHRIRIVNDTKMNWSFVE